jgi:hypothetical protein
MHPAAAQTSDGKYGRSGTKVPKQLLAIFITRYMMGRLGLMPSSQDGEFTQVVEGQDKLVGGGVLGAAHTGQQAGPLASIPPVHIQARFILDTRRLPVMILVMDRQDVDQANLIEQELAQITAKNAIEFLICL